MVKNDLLLDMCPVKRLMLAGQMRILTGLSQSGQRFVSIKKYIIFRQPALEI